MLEVITRDREQMSYEQTLETVKRETTKTIIASWLLREARQEEIEILWRYMLMRKKKR